jgi:hypothetical protein
MSPSPTGHGSWTRASTLAGPETSRAHIARTQRPCQILVEGFNGGLALSQAGRAVQRPEASWLRLRGPRNGLDGNLALIALAWVPG